MGSRRGGGVGVLKKSFACGGVGGGLALVGGVIRSVVGGMNCLLRRGVSVGVVDGSQGAGVGGGDALDFMVCGGGRVACCDGCCFVRDGCWFGGVLVVPVGCDRGRCFVSGGDDNAPGSGTVAAVASCGVASCCAPVVSPTGFLQGWSHGTPRGASLLGSPPPAMGSIGCWCFGCVGCGGVDICACCCFGVVIRVCPALGIICSPATAAPLSMRSLLRLSLLLLQRLRLRRCLLLLLLLLLLCSPRLCRFRLVPVSVVAPAAADSDAAATAVAAATAAGAAAAAAAAAVVDSAGCAALVARLGSDSSRFSFATSLRSAPALPFGFLHSDFKSARFLEKRAAAIAVCFCSSCQSMYACMDSAFARA